MQNKLITIGQAARLLGVSIDTLRRWDRAGTLQAVRSSVRGYRLYSESDIAQYMNDNSQEAFLWAQSPHAKEPTEAVYCRTRDMFQGRLETMQSRLAKLTAHSAVSLVTAIAGEIGNNSFDHNLGNWPNISGIYFSYDLRRKTIVLADRGQGVLATLGRVRPELENDIEALRVAFTQTITGRAPEARGNGLKFVRSVTFNSPIELYFQTGAAYAYLNQTSSITIKEASTHINGCFAKIEFKKII